MSQKRKEAIEGFGGVRFDTERRKAAAHTIASASASVSGSPAQLDSSLGESGDLSSSESSSISREVDFAGDETDEDASGKSISNPGSKPSSRKGSKKSKKTKRHSRSMSYAGSATGSNIDAKVGITLSGPPGGPQVLVLPTGTHPSSVTSPRTTNLPSPSHCATAPSSTVASPISSPFPPSSPRIPKARFRPPSGADSNTHNVGAGHGPSGAPRILKSELRGRSRALRTLALQDDTSSDEDESSVSSSTKGDDDFLSSNHNDGGTSTSSSANNNGNSAKAEELPGGERDMNWVAALMMRKRQHSFWGLSKKAKSNTISNSGSGQQPQQQQRDNYRAGSISKAKTPESSAQKLATWYRRQRSISTNITASHPDHQLCSPRDSNSSADPALTLAVNSKPTISGASPLSPKSSPRLPTRRKRAESAKGDLTPPASPYQERRDPKTRSIDADSVSFIEGLKRSNAKGTGSWGRTASISITESTPPRGGSLIGGEAPRPVRRVKTSDDVGNQTVKKPQESPTRLLFDADEDLARANRRREMDSAIRKDAESMQSVEDTSEPSQVVEIVEKVGKGGHAIVWKGFLNGNPIAVKQVSLFGVKDSRGLRRALKAEVETFRELHHPNILSYYGMYYSRINQEVSILLEFMEGGTLTMLIKRHTILAEEIVQQTVRQVAIALGILKKNKIIHRDVKPDNMLLNVDGIVKLCDFGEATVTTTELCRRSTVGTPWYCAPEVINGEEYGFACDIFSLGCSMVEMVSGLPPFASSGPVQALFKIAELEIPLPTGMSIECSDFLNNCLEKDWQKRRTPEELLETSFLRGESAQGFSAIRQALHDKPIGKSDGTSTFEALVDPTMERRGPMSSSGPSTSTAEQHQQHHTKSLSAGSARSAAITHTNNDHESGEDTKSEGSFKGNKKKDTKQRQLQQQVLSEGDNDDDDDIDDDTEKSEGERGRKGRGGSDQESGGSRGKRSKSVPRRKSSAGIDTKKRLKKPKQTDTGTIGGVDAVTTDIASDSNSDINDDSSLNKKTSSSGSPAKLSKLELKKEKKKHRRSRSRIEGLHVKKLSHGKDKDNTLDNMSSLKAAAAKLAQLPSESDSGSPSNNNKSGSKQHKRGKSLKSKEHLASALKGLGRHAEVKEELEPSIAAAVSSNNNKHVAPIAAAGATASVNFNLDGSSSDPTVPTVVGLQPPPVKPVSTVIKKAGSRRASEQPLATAVAAALGTSSQSETPESNRKPSRKTETDNSFNSMYNDDIYFHGKKTADTASSSRPHSRTVSRNITTETGLMSPAKSSPLDLSPRPSMPNNQQQQQHQTSGNSPLHSGTAGSGRSSPSSHSSPYVLLSRQSLKEATPAPTHTQPPLLSLFQPHIQKKT
eukprot:TRINITY_DN871_c0_g1_i2.p1 TRINITY_DN871_c0_g1~~TRINITY_DN871_c0_g1_i2.p1  ORF type:complete len:1364 (+),score=287.38 TRINITY_DN871_c0_g1_i2:288-4379(+)